MRHQKILGILVFGCLAGAPLIGAALATTSDSTRNTNRHASTFTSYIS